MSQIEADVIEFQHREEEHELELQDLRRIPCFNHLLQLVVMIFQTIAEHRKLLKKTKKLVGKFNHSAKATRSLIGLCGRKLLGDVETRWNSTYIMINRYFGLCCSWFVQSLALIEFATFQNNIIKGLKILYQQNNLIVRILLLSMN